MVMYMCILDIKIHVRQRERCIALQHVLLTCVTFLSIICAVYI